MGGNMCVRIWFACLISQTMAGAALAQGLAPGATFRDCPDCPEMIVVPAGEFEMGSPGSESGRNRNEGPKHKVILAAPFAIGRTELTRGQFAAFVRESRYSMAGTNCWYWNEQKMQGENYQHDISWQNPGYAQQDDHPVVCVDWNNAKAYLAWLTKKSGKEYRLPTEAEWEYAARAGTETARPWGEGADGGCRFANLLDAAAGQRIGGAKGRVGARRELHDCDDGFAYTAPMGRLLPNGFGIHDMIGNVSEWTADCWNESYEGAPVEGSAWLSGDCARRVERGGNWFSQPDFTRSGRRGRVAAENRDQLRGFRVARSLP